MERVLVTGASGFIGTHLTRRLHALGAQLTCVDLKEPRERLSSVSYIKGDIRAIDASRVPPVDAIWNLAAIHTTPGHPDHEYYDTNVNGALEVTRLAERLGAREIIFTSSISVYGPSEERMTETSLPAPVSAYGKSKLMAEKIQENWQAAASDRLLTVVRPAVVFGPGEGGNFARMAGMLKKGFFVFPGRRDTIKSCIYVDDLIDLMLAGHASPGRRVLLNAAYPECPTIEQIVTTLQSRYFSKARLLDVPQPLVMGVAKAIAALNGLAGIHPDRVMKLLRSTYVYPEWAAERSLLPEGAFSRGVDRWARATGGTFV